MPHLFDHLNEQATDLVCRSVETLTLQGAFTACYWRITFVLRDSAIALWMNRIGARGVWKQPPLPHSAYRLYLFVVLSIDGDVLVRDGEEYPGLFILSEGRLRVEMRYICS